MAYWTKVSLLIRPDWQLPAYGTTAI